MTQFSQMGRRMIVVAILLLGLFAYILWQLYTVQIKRHEELYKKARMKYTTVKTMNGKRGEIYDYSGNLLVGNIPCSDVCADPSIAGDADRCRVIARFLAEKLEISEESVFEKLMDKEIVTKNADGTKRVRQRKFVIIKGKVDYEIAERLKLETARLGYKCVFYRETTRRYYPKKQLLANVLGFTNLDRDQVVAVIGLEKFYDNKMRSVQGLERYERSRDGLPIAYGNSSMKEDKDGFNVYLTIQEPIQAILEEELDKFMERCNPSAAYAVMADPYTGDIIAVAQRPTFDPNDRKSMKPNAWRNRIAEDTFEPGSTIKPLVVAGAMDRGIIAPDTRFDCEKGLWFYGGKRLKDSHPMGNLTVSEIIQHSSNIGTAKIALVMGEKTLDEVLRSFGLGARTGIPLKPETVGIFRPRKQWDTLSITRFPIGQGLAVSPLQLVRSYCILANGGHPVKLRLVDRIENPATGIEQKIPLEKPDSIFKNPSTHGKIVDMMKKVTGEGGTARQAAVRGYYVAGKTGTAQKFMNGAYSKSKYIANFVGFVPADNPRFVLLVTADEPKGGYYGGSVAGPTFRTIAERTLKYLNVKPDYDADARDQELKLAKKKKLEEMRRERELRKTRNGIVPAPVKRTERITRPASNRSNRNSGRKYRYITFSKR